MADASWGPGYPTDRSSVMVKLRADGVEFPAGVQADVAPLMELLLVHSADVGWQRLHDGWCWGYANRGIKTPTGGSTNVPSNHSYGIAIDVNAPANPFGGSNHSIPEAMGDFWERYGFRWGGHYTGTKDWMHFEYMGSRTSAKADLAQAREDLLNDERLDDYYNGEQAYREKFQDKGGIDPGTPPEDKPPWFKRGWGSARFAANNPHGE